MRRVIVTLGWGVQRDTRDPAIAGSGTIACGLAACATQTAEVRLLARSDASAWRAEEEAQAEARKLDARHAGADQGDHRPDDARRLRRGRRGDRRGSRREGRAAADRWRGGARRRPGDDDLVAIGRRARRAQPAATRALLRPPRLQPGRAHGAGRALPAGRARDARRRARAGLVRGDRQDGGRGSRPDRRSSSTGCCSRTCSRPCG